MNLRCKKCGKFVAKDATVCKYCGIENPIERTPPQYHKCDTKCLFLISVDVFLLH